MKKLFVLFLIQILLVDGVFTEESKINSWYGFVDFNVGSMWQPHINGENATYTEVVNSDAIVVNGKKYANEVLAFGLSMENQFGHLIDVAIEPKGVGFSVSENECSEIISTYNQGATCEDLDRIIKMTGFNLIFRYQYLLFENIPGIRNYLDDKYFLYFGLMFTNLIYNYESSELLNLNHNTSGFGYFAGINLGFKTKMFANDVPVYWLLGFEVRYNPMSFPKLNRKIQDWQIAIPIRFAMSLY